LAIDQPQKAMPLLEQYLAERRSDSTTDGRRLAHMLDRVADVLLKHRQPSVAETYLRECLAICEEKLSDDWLLFVTKSRLGEALAGQNKFEDAQPLLIEGYEGLKESRSKQPSVVGPHLTRAAERLVDLYTSWDKPDEAEKWRSQLDAVQQ
jgi:hypothetical protein